MNIPFTISGLRKAGLTQTQIGAAIGLGQTSISDMEAGKAGVKRPTYAVVNGLTELAKQHNVPTEIAVEAA
jgi:transcriptional regulator with XRE-family HTH domain